MKGFLQVEDNPSKGRDPFRVKGTHHWDGFVVSFRQIDPQNVAVDLNGEQE